jgi:hypothetical protein
MQFKTRKYSVTNLVLRSLYLPRELDDALRSVAFHENCTKSTLMRLMLASGLDDYHSRPKDGTGHNSAEISWQKDVALFKELELTEREARHKSAKRILDEAV